MRRIAMALAAALLLAFGVGACGGTAAMTAARLGRRAGRQGATKLEPADITLWVGFTAARAAACSRTP